MLYNNLECKRLWGITYTKGISSDYHWFATPTFYIYIYIYIYTHTVLWYSDIYVCVVCYLSKECSISVIEHI